MEGDEGGAYLCLLTLTIALTSRQHMVGQNNSPPLSHVPWNRSEWCPATQQKEDASFLKHWPLQLSYSTKHSKVIHWHYFKWNTLHSLISMLKSFLKAFYSNILHKDVLTKFNNCPQMSVISNMPVFIAHMLQMHNKDRCVAYNWHLRKVIKLSRKMLL